MFRFCGCLELYELLRRVIEGFNGMFIIGDCDCEEYWFFFWVGWFSQLVSFYFYFVRYFDIYLGF